MTHADRSWICTVCGYVHQGENPPGICPVCGATQDLFEPHQPAASAAGASSVNQWRCLNCEYVHQGNVPPAVCPVCGAPADRFEPAAARPPSAAVASNISVVVVGAGIAGVSAAEALRASSPGIRITLVSKENDLPYYRLNLTRYLAAEIDAAQLPLHPEDWYTTNAVEFRRNIELTGIDTGSKRLSFRGTGDTGYDKLILATGSHPFLPPLPGAEKENVSVLRTRSDADFIIDAAASANSVAVIGGGVLGLETAAALAKRGHAVTLLEGHDWLMPRQLNRGAAQHFQEHVSSLGITLATNARTTELTGEKSVQGVKLDNGTLVPAELVIVTTGVRSNSYTARLANIDVNRGIVVANDLQTSAVDVFAAGDAAEHRGVNYGTWGPAQFMGTIAGMNAAGDAAEFGGMPRSNMLKVLGYDMFSIGTITPDDGSCTVVESQMDNAYFMFLFRDSHLAGTILLGDTKYSARVKNAVEHRSDFSALCTRKPGVGDILEYLGGLA